LRQRVPRARGMTLRHVFGPLGHDGRTLTCSARVKIVSRSGSDRAAGQKPSGSIGAFQPNPCIIFRVARAAASSAGSRFSAMSATPRIRIEKTAKILLVGRTGWDLRRCQKPLRREQPLRRLLLRLLCQPCWLCRLPELGECQARLRQCGRRKLRLRSVARNAVGRKLIASRR
jgi:hypothetical protein